MSGRGRLRLAFPRREQEWQSPLVQHGDVWQSGEDAAPLRAQARRIFAPDRLRRYPAVLDLVRDADVQGKVVGAICHAGWVLCSARIVKGRTVTSVPAIKDDLINAGANWVDQEVVRDGRLVTSRHPADLPAFCRTLIAALAEVTSPVAAGR